MENRVEVSVKDASEVVKSMEQAEAAINEALRERDDMHTALLEAGAEIDRLRGVVREATQRIAADRVEKSLVAGALIASSTLLDRKSVIAGIVERLAHQMLDHSIRHQDGLDKWAKLSFDFAEKLYGEGVARGVYDAEPQAAAAE